MICWSSGQNAEHTLEQCTYADKWSFVRAKTKARQQGSQMRGGWLARYRACFGCGNIQVVCQKQGKGGCKYKDVLMPLCWTVSNKLEWIDRVLREYPRGLAASKDKDKFMLWLGEEATVLGEQGTNMALVGLKAVQVLLQDG